MSISQWWSVHRCAKIRIILVQKYLILPHFTAPSSSWQTTVSKPFQLYQEMSFLSLKHYFSSQGARGQSATSGGWEYRCTNVSGHDGVQPRQLRQSCGAAAAATLPHGEHRWQWRSSKVHRSTVLKKKKKKTWSKQKKWNEIKLTVKCWSLRTLESPLSLEALLSLDIIDHTESSFLEYNRNPRWCENRPEVRNALHKSLFQSMNILHGSESVEHSAPLHE